MGKHFIPAEAGDFDWSQYEDGWNGSTLKVNKSVKTGDKHIKVYSHESYAENLFKQYNKSVAPVSKEIQKDTLVKISDFAIRKDNTILASINGGANDIVIDLNKEQKFLNTMMLDGQTATKESFLQCLKDPEIRKEIVQMGLTAKVGSDIGKASIWDGYVENLSNEMKEQITKKTNAYTAKIVSSNNGGFVVEVANAIKAFMPGSMAAANKLTDYAALIGQTMEVMVENFDPKLGFIVSRKKYLQTILPMHMNNIAEIVKKNPEAAFSGKVTGSTPYGVFIELDDFGHCLTGMIHKSLMSDALREKLRNNEVKPDDTIVFFVHKISREGKNLRLIFTDVPLAEREAVIARREAEDAAEKAKTTEKRDPSVMA